MLCYRDMTFCPYWKKCAGGKGCFRALTKEVKAKSILIGLPICQFADKPDCYEEAEDD